MGFRNYLFRSSKANAVKRGHEFYLTFDQYMSLIRQNCYYCGNAPRPATSEVLSKRGNPKQPTFYYNGIDRLDSTKDYTLDNCVPCCPMCNYMKNTYSVDAFYNQIRKIYKFKNLGSETISKESTTQVNGVGSGNPCIR